MNDRASGTLVMVRTTCCETVKETGVRCSICPHRPENASAAREFEQALRFRRARLAYSATPLCGTAACSLVAE
jgi:hypothetical protein